MQLSSWRITSKTTVNNPFFHYLAFIAPHFPLHAKPEDIAKYQDRYLSGWDKLREERFAKQKKIGLHKTSLSALEPELAHPMPSLSDQALRDWRSKPPSCMGFPHR